MKAFYTLLLLCLGATVFAQEDLLDFKITFKHSNGAIANSAIKVTIQSDFFDYNNDSICVNYEVFKEIRSKKISKDKFAEIIDEIKKILFLIY